MSDVLDRLLATLDTRLHAFAVCEVQRGFRLVFDPMKAVVIHYVLAGTGLLQVGAAPPVRFGPHFILIVPPGQSQSLRASNGDLRDFDAAQNCSSRSHFSRTFSAAYGIDPSTYRSLNASQDEPPLPPETARPDTEGE